MSVSNAYPVIYQHNTAGASTYLAENVAQEVALWVGLLGLFHELVRLLRRRFAGRGTSKGIQNSPATRSVLNLSTRRVLQTNSGGVRAVDYEEFEHLTPTAVVYKAEGR
jgi:hypothetical protein